MSVHCARQSSLLFQFYKLYEKGFHQQKIFTYVFGGFSGAVEAFARRNGSGLVLQSEHSRHRSSDDVPSSKDVVSICVIIVFSLWIGGYPQTSIWDCLYLIFLSCNTYPLQQADSERPRSSSRNGSSSKKPVLSSSRPSSSGEPSESRTSRLVLSSGRLSTTQRLQPGFESKTSLSRASATRGGRDDTLRSFELLSLGSGKRKWRTVWSADFLFQGS